MTDTQPRTGQSEGIVPGSRFGEYRIVRELGRGGMGIVYLAEQEHLGRRVALKLLAARHAASEKALERFEREVRAVARLSDPNIVAIYDVGRVEGQPFFTMEYVEGRTLHDLLHDLRQGRRAPESLRGSDLVDTALGVTWPESLRQNWIDATCYVVSHMADALSHVHAQGIVHRDVKPKNILLSRDGRVLLFDFGVARVDTEAAMTVSGEFVGTPFYVSPEQVDPPDNGVDERTDIYSLGVTLYEALTLEVPFEGESPQQIFKRITQREPKSIRQLNSQVPRDLQTVCAMAMARERGRRYQSAADFAADLRRFMELKPVFARPLGPFGRVTLWMRRKPTVAALVVSSVILFLLVALNWQQRSVINAERTANALAAFRAALVLQQQGRIPEAITELQHARDGGYDAVAVAVAMVETLEAGGDDASALRELNSLRGRQGLGVHAGKVKLLAGDLGVERLRSWDAGLELVRQASDSGELSAADACYAQALLAVDAEKALVALEQTLALHQGHVRARASYGPTLLSLGRRDEAARYAERMKAAQPDDPCALLFSMLTYALLGDTKRASADFEQARRCLGPQAEEPLVAWAKHVAVASLGSQALLHWVLRRQAFQSGEGPIDPARVLVAISELMAGLKYSDAAGGARAVHFRLPPAVARGYAGLVQAFSARGIAPLSGRDLEAVLELLDDALEVHPDGLRFVLRAILGQRTRGSAQQFADLDRAAGSSSMVAVARVALFEMLRVQMAALRGQGFPTLRKPGPTEATAGRPAHSVEPKALCDFLRRLVSVDSIEPDAYPLLLDAAVVASEPLLVLELALRWRRESPQTLPVHGLTQWLPAADSERVMRQISPPR